MFHVSLLFGGYVDKAGGIDQSVIQDLGFLRAVLSFIICSTRQLPFLELVSCMLEGAESLSREWCEVGLALGRGETSR